MFRLFPIRSASSRLPENASPNAVLASLRSDEDKRIVVLRSALRAFPGTADIGTGPWRLGSETELHIRLHAIRAIFVTWSQLIFDGVRSGAQREAFDALAVPLAKLDEGLPDFYNQNIMSSDYAVASWQHATEAARRAVSLVESIETLSFRDLPFDKGDRDADFLDTLNVYAPTGSDARVRWWAAQRAAISGDCSILREKKLTLAELALAPLWPDSTSASLESNLTMGLNERNARELGRRIAMWLRERQNGSLILNMDAEQARERVVRTANLSRSFWESRSPADTLYAFDYCLHGDLNNPNWGSDTSAVPPSI